MAELWLDPFAGISGDMFLGALLDAGLPLAGLRADLKRLRLPAWSLKRTDVMRGALRGTRLTVKVADVHHPHRGLKEITRLIRSAGLPPRVVSRALAVFTHLGNVEARLHGVPVSRIHFHEVGALDAVVDIVGVCAGLERLGVDRVWTSAVNVGSGRVRAGHGWLPVPAPATTELLKGFTVFSAGPAAEHTTPTGAALLSALARPVPEAPPLVFRSVGYGAGERSWPDFPNLLRATLCAEPKTARAVWDTDEVAVLTAHLDDATPQMLGYAQEALLRAGAWDAVLGPLGMKKNRPGHKLEVLCRPEDAALLAGVMFRETTTLGLRVDVQRRFLLKRRLRAVKVGTHRIRVKVAYHGDRVLTAVPEYEDVKACAQALNQSWRSVAQKAIAQFKEKA
jgi:pyridinium-3,5-bisthiocarboxylic acid mononucleotide nickel chelatase